jgi:hypothetical protein
MLKLSTAALASAFILAMATSAQAVPVFFSAGLSGANESPPNGSLGTGYATVLFDTAVHTMEVTVSFSGLSAPNTAAHIHCCTAVPGTGTTGVATSVPTFTGFPAGTMAGFYTHIFDMTDAASYNPAFLGNAINLGSTATAEMTLFNGMVAGTEYLNIHTTAVPSGEIRGFLKVPEPLTLSLFGVGLAGMAALRRKRQAKSA